MIPTRRPLPVHFHNEKQLIHSGMKLMLVKTCALGFVILSRAQLAAGPLGSLPATSPNTAIERLGIYDSRVVGYAFFWSAPQQQQLAERVKAAKAAQASGNTAQFRELDKNLAEEQKKLHDQVFSTAPVPQALDALKDRIPDIRKEAKVSVLISKWDQAALAQHPGAKTIDVTDLLVREFHPAEQQLKTITEIKKQKPVPLEKMQRIHSVN
jgi:hypothetical protein